MEAILLVCESFSFDVNSPAFALASAVFEVRVRYLDVAVVVLYVAPGAVVGAVDVLENAVLYLHFCIVRKNSFC